eukprot:gene1063-10582_t
MNFHQNSFKFEGISEENKKRIFLTVVDKLNEGDISTAILRLRSEWISQQDLISQEKKTTNLDASLFSIYAQCLRSMGEYDEAIKYFDFSKKLFEEENLQDEYGIVHDVGFDAGKYYMEQKNYEKAIEFFNLGLKKGKKENDEKCLSGIAIANENLKNYDTAEKYFLKLIEIYPETSNYYNDIAIFYQTKKVDFQKSEFYFLKGIKIDSSNLLIQCHYGILLLEKGEDEKSKEMFENVLKEIPNNPDVLRFLGMIYLKEGDIEKSKQKFTSANKWKPNDPAILGYLALIEHRLGNLKQSKNIYGHALSLINESNFNQDLLNNFITLLIDLEHFEEVEEAFNTYLDKFPDNQAFLGNYAIFLSNYKKDQFERAEEYFLKATQNEEYFRENEDIYTTNMLEFSKFYQERDEIHKAKNIFEKLISMSNEPNKLVYKEFVDFLNGIPKFKKLAKKYSDIEKNL